MTSGIKTIIYPVKDLERAKALFGALLGVAPTMDEPYYVGYSTAGQEIGLNPQGHSQGMTAPLAYWHVDDVNAVLAELLAKGAQAAQPVTDVGGGKLIASVTDPDGNTIGLLQEH
jgi:predicted enzyme related to lactoylglutathione lyase